MNELQTGRSFALAVADVLNLPKDRMLEDVHMQTGADSIITVRVEFFLNADDLAAIAQRMKDAVS